MMIFNHQCKPRDIDKLLKHPFCFHGKFVFNIKKPACFETRLGNMSSAEKSEQ